ncbi:DUF305 domain-containing protein [Phenylobacterium sp.]|uniref:DUF305 domain-containing protein n=1 Tax=Phenylobacterium sp. TaxID=1871053 RepID=UPI00374D63D0
MRTPTLLLTAISALILSAGVASAQSATGAMKDMKGMDHGSMPGMAKGGMKGMGDRNMMAMHDDMTAMKKMDRAMMAAKGATPDVAFARKMLAHHQGAIEMAQIELKHGTDAEAKRMAQQMIDDQTKSKAELEAWLKTHGG